MSKFKIDKSSKNQEIQEIYGFHSVIAALENSNRKHIKLSIIEKYSYLATRYRNKVPEIKIIDQKEMSKIYGRENTYQGIVLESYSINQIDFEQLILNEKIKEKSILIILDQIKDPQNIGSIMRSCALFGCCNIITSKDNSPDITSSLIKSASGAAEIVNYIKVVNIKRSISKLKNIGYWIFAFDKSNKFKVIEKSISKKSVFVFGSEDKGIRKQIKKECDEVLHLKSNPNKKFGIDSLNVSNAASIALYEYFKKFRA